MTDCPHNDKSKSIDCATELLAARKEVMRLRTENAELRVKLPRWISVKDRLPITEADMVGKQYECIEHVIVAAGNSRADFRDFAAGMGGGYWGKFTYNNDEVTHWLEVLIPAQPQSSNEQSTT